MKDLSNKKRGFFSHCSRMVINSVAGFIIAFKTERSFRIHFAFGFVLPILLAILSQILGVTLHTWEWYAVIGFGVFLLTVELLNTGIEEAINVSVNEFNLKAKKGKDCASAAVFLVGTLTLCSNLYIFINKLVELLGR